MKLLSKFIEEIFPFLKMSIYLTCRSVQSIFFLESLTERDTVRRRSLLVVVFLRLAHVTTLSCSETVPERLCIKS